MNPLGHPLAHIREGVTIVLGADAARVLCENTNSVSIYKLRSKDWSPVVRAQLAALLSAGQAAASADASGNGSAALSDTEVVEELTLSGSPSGRGMTSAAVADLAGISDSGVRLACREGRLTAERVGSRWLIAEDDARRWAQDREDVAS